MAKKVLNMEPVVLVADFQENMFRRIIVKILKERFDVLLTFKGLKVVDKTRNRRV